MNKNWVFVPHLVIAAAYWAWSHGVVGEGTGIALALGAHLAAPAWAVYVARRHEPWRVAPWPAFWSGPGLLIGIHAASLLLELWQLVQEPPADPWRALAWLAAWAIVIAVYAGYAVVVFAVGARRGRIA